MPIFNDEPEEEKLPDPPIMNADMMNYTIILLTKDRVMHHIYLTRSPASNQSKPDEQFHQLSGWKNIGFSES